MANLPVYGPRQFRLLIAGSRKANAALLQKAHRAVARAEANGWAVLVGDADGVDSAVIAACNQLRVNYLCFGLAEKPRSTSYQSLSEGGTGRYLRVTTDKPYDYPVRDRRMADLADRGLFLWNGESKGTYTVYEYLKALDKPADLLTFKNSIAQPASAPTQPTPTPRQPAIIEVILDSGPVEQVMVGKFGLRALTASGDVLYQVQEDLPRLGVAVADYAKLHALIRALERLTSKLRGNASSYTLQITQSSKNVEGWLAHGWKRNMDTVKQLSATADDLLKCFPHVEWVKVPRAQILTTLSSIR